MRRDVGDGPMLQVVRQGSEAVNETLRHIASAMFSALHTPIEGNQLYIVNIQGLGSWLVKNLQLNTKEFCRHFLCALKSD